MKSCVDIFTQLGARLRLLPESVVEQAMQQNSWFFQIDVAVDAIRSCLLDKNKIEAWLANYNIISHAPKRVAIIMAGNIPAVVFFDLMCVIASGNIPVIKYSSKDRVLMEYIVQCIREIEPEIVIDDYDGGAVDAVIATGSDSAALHFKAAYSSVPTLIRSSRHSVAVLTGKESKEQIEELSKDIFYHCGLGCRSVSLIFAPQGFEFSLSVPDMPQGYKNNYLHSRALLTMQDREFTDLGSALLVEGGAEFPKQLSCINLCRYSDLSEVKEWIAKNRNLLQIVVSAEKSLPYRVEFGRAQYPGLNDYADNIDIMKFLLTL